MSWKVKIVKEEDNVEDIIRKKNNQIKILIFVVLLGVLAFLVYEFKFAEKGKFNNGDKYEEYDENFTFDEENKINNEEKASPEENVPASNEVKQNPVSTEQPKSNTQVVKSNTTPKSNTPAKSNTVSNNTQESDSVSNNQEVTNTSGSFETDSWETISKNIKSGNTSKYKVGDIKTIKLDVNKDGKEEEYRVRIDNMSTSSGCSSSDYSQTSCGFIVEFVDVIGKMNINDSTSTAGSWPGSKIRTYLNNEFYNLLPSDLKNVIASSKVYSAVGADDLANSNTNKDYYVSDDKIFLLSVIEVFDVEKSPVFKDTELSKHVNRLDIYKLAKDNITLAQKFYNGNASDWWVRDPHPQKEQRFYGMSDKPSSIISAPNNKKGVAPAFRIG